MRKSVTQTPANTATMASMRRLEFMRGECHTLPRRQGRNVTLGKYFCPGLLSFGISVLPFRRVTRFPILVPGATKFRHGGSRVAGAHLPPGFPKHGAPSPACAFRT